MQGIIFDIKRFAVHDGPGIRTTVFMKGCPLYCHWCHNPEGRSPHPDFLERSILLDGKRFHEKEVSGRVVSVDEVMSEVIRERLVMEESGGGVTFSGGEPLMQADFLVALLKASEREGIHTAVDTSGFTTRNILERVTPFTNLFLFDIKLIDDRLHCHHTGVSNKLILDNFRWLAHQGKEIRVRIPLIRGISATPENISQTADFINSCCEKVTQIDLLPYHSTGEHKYKRIGIRSDMPPREAELRDEEVKEIAAFFSDRGFNVKTGG